MAANKEGMQGAFKCINNVVAVTNTHQSDKVDFNFGDASKKININ